MILGRVVGSIVSTVKHPVYRGTTLLLVETVDMDGNETGPTMLALDTVGAGAGELVLVCKEGSAALQVLGAEYAPVRSFVIGVVDEVKLANGRSLTE